MRVAVLFLIAFFSVLLVNAQGLSHAVGMHYASTYEGLGNSDRVSFLYVPQLQQNKGSVLYGISSPLKFGLLNSSRRGEVKRPMYLEVPLMVELGYNLNTPYTSFKYLSMFTGFGYSREYKISDNHFRRDYLNFTVGIRIPPFRCPMEIRFNYSQCTNAPDVNRVGIGVAYLISK